jgi:hypothetical protein
MIERLRALIERLRSSWRDSTPGALSSAYRDSTNARLDAIEREIAEIKMLLISPRDPPLRK